MLVTDLQEMEDIVSQRSDLEWYGWDVAQYKKSGESMFHKDGIYKNNTWYKRKIFPITSQGWNIPEYLGRKNVRLEG
jgi:hypothetical protein